MKINKYTISSSAFFLLMFFLNEIAYSLENSNQWSYSGSNVAGVFNVKNSSISVEISEKNAWTITDISYKNKQIVGSVGIGLNGCVVNIKPLPDEKTNPDAQWIGTGHGHEVVRRVNVIAETKEYDFKSAFNGFSSEICFKKESNLGPLDHVAEIVFPKSGDRLIEKHQFKVVEDLGLRFNYLYAFMHCNLNSFNQWFAELEDGVSMSGECLKDDSSFMLHKNIRSLIFYSLQNQCGIAYIYPEVYLGADVFKNAIWDRAKDNKFYFRPEIKNMKVGDVFEYILTVIPFTSSCDEWKMKGSEFNIK